MKEWTNKRRAAHITLAAEVSTSIPIGAAKTPGLLGPGQQTIDTGRSGFPSLAPSKCRSDPRQTGTPDLRKNPNCILQRWASPSYCGFSGRMISSRAMLRCGYLSPEYVASQAECGQPLALPRSGGWLLERRIPGSEATDAMGPYPIFCCSDWSVLGDDLAGLGDRLVSLVLVTDPFGPGRPGRPGRSVQPRPGSLQGPPRHRPRCAAGSLGLPASSTQCPQRPGTTPG